jgi:hypothetical protein
MHRIKIGVFVFALVSLSLAPLAIAADPPTRPTTTPVQSQPSIELAPKFTCSINPPAGKPNAPPITAVTVKKTSGALKHDTEVLIRLGLAPSGAFLAHICGYHFVNDKATLTHVPVPAISDPNYIWLCNAAVGKRRCKPQPQPQPPR